ncbi:hypothetical protein D6D21_03907 [Aureobasidium pullulans]|uniref:N-acetyltransferase domain-containing protein n=1 Tax=Aureobasidium pullulans TaxID=5580 RepID=A0AB74J1M0_AURPU|nr:hypothetical protein D6D21_03907 [Aureobasidium pullulans]
MIDYTKHEGAAITEDMIDDIAVSFSENYGVWGPAVKPEKQGRRVRASPARLRADCLPSSPARNFLVQAKDKHRLVGHVIATRWTFENLSICWITQLCVNMRYRHQGLATKLLIKLSEDNDDSAVGILSSHPFAIAAVLRALGKRLRQTNECVGNSQIKTIMASCPIDYVRTARLRGSAFESNVHDGTISCADTKFFVDHAEPHAALDALRDKGIKWPLGRLPEGHEFLAFVERP